MIIKKKIWPEFFDMVAGGEKKFELRLADFSIKAGDILVLEEYDPRKKAFTGRKISRQCKSVAKINPTAFHSAEEVKKHGLYVIEL